MRVLVTGGNGVLGQAFKAIAQEEWIFTTSLDGDLTDRQDSFNLIAKNQPTHIMHCAALSGGVGISAKHPATLLRDNVLMSINILEAARDFEVTKTIMSLSSGMYTPSQLPIVEDQIHIGSPHISNYAYAHAKRLIEPLIRSYHAEFGMNVIGLVPNGIFGEHDYFGLDDCNMLAALVSKFYAASQTKDDIILWGDGTPLRELTYAPDLARAYMWALENYNDAQILNVGNTEEQSIRDIAYDIAEVFSISPKRLIWDSTKPNGPYRKPTDNSRFLALSGFTYTPFETAITNTIRWYCDTMNENPKSIRIANKVQL